MARPTKKIKELRHRIIKLDIFKRDNKIYTYFEDKFLNNKIDRYVVPYYFCEECSIRANEDILTIKEFRKFFLENEEEYEERYEELLKILKELENIDISITEYYMNINVDNYYLSNSNWDKARYNEYNSYVKLDYNLVERALGEKRTNELVEDTGLTLDYMLDDSFTYEYLKNEEKEKLLKSLDEKIGAGYKVIIERLATSLTPEDIIEDIIEHNRNKKVYAELDLTKSKEELIEFVSKLKDDFDEDPSKFPNAYELLGVKQEVTKCTLKDCEIYKKPKSLKGFSGRLSDVLFIYDCKKVNKLLGGNLLSEDYIIGEIERYWREVKKISNDGFYSLKEYEKIGIEFIDNEEYKDYLSGVKKP